MNFADLYLDRQKMKKSRNLWRIFTIFSFVLLLVIASISDIEVSSPKTKAVGRIKMDQIIYFDTKQEQILNDIAEDKNITALIVHIDSPGGSATGGEMFYKSLKRVAENKPVVAVLDSVAASGGYMAAVAAGWIVAMQNTITGSIGVIAESYNMTELAEKLGVQRQAFKSGPLKASPSPFEKLTPEVKQAMDDVIADTYEMFIKLVADGRKMDIEKVRKLADGRIYTGNQALKLGLIDQIGGEEQALLWLRAANGINTEHTREITLYPKDYNLYNIVPEGMLKNFHNVLEKLTNWNIKL